MSILSSRVGGVAYIVLDLSQLVKRRDLREVVFFSFSSGRSVRTLADGTG